MFVKQLFDVDGQLESIHYDGVQDNHLEGVSISNHLKDNSLVFIKDNKFFKRVAGALEGKSFQNLGLIVAKSFWETCKEKEMFQKQFAYILSTKDVTLFMTNFSKLLHDEKFGSLDLFRDGRDLETAKIDESAQIGANVFIGDNVTIEAHVKIHAGSVLMSGVEIGENSIIFPNVSIYSFSKIGKNCRIHAGTTIGVDGFGYNFFDGVHKKVWHTGGVIIEDNVEIGANSCVDMGTFTPTIIRTGTKIDNQVQVAHNVELGQGAVLCGQVGIGGSVNVGPYAVFGGQAGVTHDVSIGAQAQVGGFSAVTSNIEPQTTVAGTPARPIKEWLAGLAYLRKNSIRKK